MPEEDATIWMRWLDTLSDLDKVKIPRCFITLSMEFDSLTQRQLHHFADASQKGYGIVSYLRVVAPDGSIFYSFVLGKARLAPIKTVSIPRIEPNILQCELFWTSLDLGGNFKFFKNNFKLVLIKVIACEKHRT